MEAKATVAKPLRAHVGLSQRNPWQAPPVTGHDQTNQEQHLRRTLQDPEESIDFVVWPELAQHWLSSFNYMHQRPIRDFHVQSLARMMSDGIFRPKTQINFMRMNGRFFLTNGQHTLSAILKSGAEQRLCVVVSDAASLTDIADDFSRHDTHLTRQLSDSLVAHEVDQELGVTRSQLQWIAAATFYYKFLLGELSATSARQTTHDEKLAAINKYGRLGKKALSYFEGHQNEGHLTRKSTLATVMACADKFEHAEEFWVELAKDDGLRSGDPRKTLLKWLQSRMTHGGTSMSTTYTKKSTADHVFVKGIARAWNAWVDGRDLSDIKTDFDAPTATLNKVGVLYVKAGSQERLTAMSQLRKGGAA